MGTVWGISSAVIKCHHKCSSISLLFIPGLTVSHMVELNRKISHVTLGPRFEIFDSDELNVQFLLSEDEETFKSLMKTQYVGLISVNNTKLIPLAYDSPSSKLATDELTARLTISWLGNGFNLDNPNPFTMKRIFSHRAALQLVAEAPPAEIIQLDQKVQQNDTLLYTCIVIGILTICPKQPQLEYVEVEYTLRSHADNFKTVLKRFISPISNGSLAYPALYTMQDCTQIKHPYLHVKVKVDGHVAFYARPLQNKEPMTASKLYKFDTVPLTTYKGTPNFTVACELNLGYTSKQDSFYDEFSKFFVVE